jgi:hypothetical protein
VHWKGIKVENNMLISGAVLKTIEGKDAEMLLILSSSKFYKAHLQLWKHFMKSQGFGVVVWALVV